MFKFSRSLFIVLCIAPVASKVHAGDVFSIAQLIEIATAHHPERPALEAQQISVEAFRAVAGRWPDPEFSGEIGRKSVRDTGESGPDYTLEITQTFEAPGKAEVRRSLADKQVDMTDMRLRQVMRELAADITGLAVSLKFNSALRDRMDADLADIEQRLAGYLQRRPAGAIQQIEQRLAGSALKSLRAESLEIRRETDALRGALNLRLGRAPDASLTVSDEITALPELDDQASISNHPLFVLRAMEVEAAELEVAFSRREARPDFSVGPYYSRASAGEEEYTVGVSFAMPLPLWNRGRREVVMAQIRQNEVEAEALRAGRELQAAWREHGLEARHDQALLEEYSADYVETLRDTALLAARQFESGAVSPALYLETQNEYWNAQRRHYEALTGLHRAAAAFTELTRNEEKP